MHSRLARPHLQLHHARAALRLLKAWAELQEASRGGGARILRKQQQLRALLLRSAGRRPGADAGGGQHHGRREGDLRQGCPHLPLSQLAGCGRGLPCLTLHGSVASCRPATAATTQPPAALAHLHHVAAQRLLHQHLLQQALLLSRHGQGWEHLGPFTRRRHGALLAAGKPLRGDGAGVGRRRLRHRSCWRAQACRWCAGLSGVAWPLRWAAGQRLENGDGAVCRCKRLGVQG